MKFLHIFFLVCIGTVLCTTQSVFAGRKFKAQSIDPKIKTWYIRLQKNKTIDNFDIAFAKHYGNKFTDDFDNDLQDYLEDLACYQISHDGTIPTNYDELQIARNNFMQYISYAYKEKKIHTNAKKIAQYVYNNNSARCLDMKQLKRRKEEMKKALSTFEINQKFFHFKDQSTAELQDPILATKILYKLINNRIKDTETFNKELEDFNENLKTLKTLR